MYLKTTATWSLMLVAAIALCFLATTPAPRAKTYEEIYQHVKQINPLVKPLHRTSANPSVRNN